MEDEAYATRTARVAAAEGWSVRQVEDAVRERAAASPRTPSRRGGRVRPAAIIELEERLSERLGTKVKITYSDKGGRLTVNYASLDDLERIYRGFFGG